MEPLPLLFKVRSSCFNQWPSYPFRKLDIRRQLSLETALLWISPPLPSSCLAGVGKYFLLIPSPARETLRKSFAYLICISCNLRGQVDWHVINLKTEWLCPELAWQKLNLKSSVFEKYSPTTNERWKVYVSQCPNIRAKAGLDFWILLKRATWKRGKPRVSSGEKEM